MSVANERGEEGEEEDDDNGMSGVGSRKGTKDDCCKGEQVILFWNSSGSGGPVARLAG